MSKAIRWILGIVLALMVIGQLVRPSHTDVAAASASTQPPVTAQVAPTPEQVPIHWHYDEQRDEMRGTVRKYAWANADEQLQFAFPYGGGSTPSIRLRKSGRGTEVLLDVSKGQFMCFIDGCWVYVKFDGGAVTRYSAVPPSDGTSNVLFLDPAAQFVKKLKKANHVTIEAEFYQEGKRQMTFDVAGLDWK